MARESQFIFELKQKMDGLFEWAHSKGLDLDSPYAIARNTPLKRNTIVSNLEVSAMPPATQQVIAREFGFSEDWPEWRNPDIPRNTPGEQRNDTAKLFLEKFRLNKAAGLRLTIQSGRTQPRVDSRFADFSLLVSGSFSPSEDTNEIPLILRLSFDERGWPVLIEGDADILTVGLKEVDIRLEAVGQDRTSGEIVANPIVCHSDTEGNFSGVVRGFRRDWWVIKVSSDGDAWLSGVRAPNDGQDCICRGFRPGDIVRAVMTARINGCFVELTGRPFENISTAKKVFIAHLIKLGVLDGAEAVLAEQDLTLVEAP